MILSFQKIYNLKNVLFLLIRPVFKENLFLEISCSEKTFYYSVIQQIQFFSNDSIDYGLLIRTLSKIYSKTSHHRQGLLWQETHIVLIFNHAILQLQYNNLSCIVSFPTEWLHSFDGENGNRTITSQIFRKERLLWSVLTQKIHVCSWYYSHCLFYSLRWFLRKINRCPRLCMQLFGH